MAFETKRTEEMAIFDPIKHPLPNGLKKRLDIVSRSFFTARMRNLDMLEEKDKRMYGFMTYYDGNGYCWVQPMKSKSHDHDVEYDRYIRRINKAGRAGELGYLDKNSIKVGMDVVAQYEVDNSWYRAMVVDKFDDDHWMVLFADFGNLQRCGVEEIKKTIHEKDCDHYHSALQAVCCRLYNILPNSAIDQESIDISLTDFYAQNTNQILELYVRNIRPDYVVDCDLFIPKRGSVGENRLYRRHVGQFLVDKGLATFADPINARAIKPPPTQIFDIITIDENQDVNAENIKPDIKSNIKMDSKPDIKFLSAPRVVQYSM